MIISLANLIVDHDPMAVALRTQDTMRYAQAEWTKLRCLRAALRRGRKLSPARVKSPA